jgi:ankyrin repeat protein
MMRESADAAMCGDLDYFIRRPWATRDVHAMEAAARHGQMHIIKHFTESVVGVGFGNSMHFACERGHLAIVTLLAEKDASASGLSTHTLWTPLMHAAQSGHLHVVNYLVENVDCNIDAISGGAARTTALHRACHAGHTEIVWALLKAGANTTIVDGWGNTPAMVAKTLSPACHAILHVSVDPSTLHFCLASHWNMCIPPG